MSSRWCWNKTPKPFSRWIDFCLDEYVLTGAWSRPADKAICYYRVGGWGLYLT
jgi:hypothetical protein